MNSLRLPPLEWDAWRGWSAPLMSPVQASPGLLLYFAAPTTHAKRLAGALAKPSLREGQELSGGVGRHSTPFSSRRGERSWQWGARRSEVKGEVGRSPAGGHERSRVPHCQLRLLRKGPPKTATFNQHHCPSKRTTP